MATITKNNDGDVSLGNLRGELITLQPAVADYVTGGYLLQGIGGNPLTAGDVGLTKVLGMISLSGQQGLIPSWNAATQKVQIFQTGADAGVPLGLGPVSTGVSTTVGIVGANNGVLTVNQPNTLKAGQVILYKSTGAGAAISGQILVVASATAAAWTANVGMAAAISAATADVTITYQVVQAGTGNAVSLGTAVNITTSLASASLLTLTGAAGSTAAIAVGSFIYVQGSVNATNANGQIVQVLTNSGTAITANWTGSTAGGTGGAETTLTIQPLVTSGGAQVTMGPATQVFNSVTTASSAGVAGVATLSAYNSLTPNSIVVAQGLVNGSPVNGDLLVVNAASLTAKIFVANHQMTAISTAADTGVVSQLVTGTVPVGLSISGSEVSTGTDLSSLTFQFLVIGL
jgi:hypothetical protein